MTIRENLERVRARIEAAARRAGREPVEVRLICVTKGIPVERIQEAIACGIAEIGENRVQEAREKERFLYRGLSPQRTVPWHLVGTLQRNKVKPAVELFDLIHSVDSLELIEAFNRHDSEITSGAASSSRSHAAGGRSGFASSSESHAVGRKLEALIQVNVSGEATRHGCRPQEAATLAEAILKSKGLTWAGLMTMAPFSENPESARPFFRQLRQLRDDLQDQFLRAMSDERRGTLHLSMGMSQDFEVAVEEGATMVRIGTAIFQP